MESSPSVTQEALICTESQILSSIMPWKTVVDQEIYNFCNQHEERQQDACNIFIS
jgi:hypothetical protein